MILVDHHRPIEELAHFEIDTIIDHHTLGEAALHAKRIYVDTDAGSCCTLLNTNRFRKVTSHFDKGEYKKLKKIAKLRTRDIKKIVKKIKKVRRNDKDLETDIILMKDYKGFKKDGHIFGYATVKYPFEKWVDREAEKAKVPNDKKAGLVLESQFSFFRREAGLDFLLVNLKMGPRRFLACVNCPFEKQLAAAQNFIPVNYKGLHFYELPVEKTRKILTPVIKKMLKKLELDEKKDNKYFA
ncbi:uncharacterized protein LOC143921875 [Arctopsyche grandis]|uniref:uncharacterized protein LOC143921875 n=1 Tax=Arctopsyche grandis TaxID=121162 RepID=UPI00406D8A63